LFSREAQQALVGVEMRAREVVQTARAGRAIRMAATT
jgi:hypothetical protein